MAQHFLLSAAVRSLSMGKVTRMSDRVARIEKRPPRLNLASYPYLPQTSVRTTSASDYAVLLSASAA